MKHVSQSNLQMYRVVFLMTLITCVVSMSEEEQCRDMFENFIEGLPLQPFPQYCRGVSRWNNSLKITSPLTLEDCEERKGKEKIGRKCECPELEIIWKVRCLPCPQDQDSNMTEDESHLH